MFNHKCKYYIGFQRVLYNYYPSASDNVNNLLEFTGKVALPDECDVKGQGAPGSS